MMKKIKIPLFIIVLLSCIAAWGQVNGNGELLNTKYKDLPQESIFVHHNSSLFFTGEYIFYKVYCMNSETHKLSRLSKVAYVELVGSEQQVVFQHKVALTKGIGQGDFFIPNTVASGNYKLVAYTQWMKNGGLERFFQSDISIVNPYRGDQFPILNDATDENTSITSDSSEKIIPITYSGDKNYSEFELELNKQKFKPREEVLLSFKNFIRERGLGNYSLSVKKIDALPAVSNHTAMGYHKFISNTNNNQKNAKQLKYIPESKGAIVSGKVIDKQTGLAAQWQDVAISISGTDFFFKVTTTDANGAFSFSLDPYYIKDTAFLQLVNEDRDGLRIELNERTTLDYSKLSYASFTIDETMGEAIKNRSVHNQIENGYFSVKPDTVRALPMEKPFTAYERIEKYNLDDYTRFPTMEEVFKEIVKAVWTANDANGKKVVKVFNNEFSAPSEDPPLLFIDGAFVANPEDFLAYDALKVQRVSMLRNQYKFGLKDYQGVLLIETIARDYKNSTSEDYAKEMVLFPSQRKKNYYFQTYRDPSKSARIPDFRSQLLWEPSIVLTSSESKFTFFTSDNVGTYEISLEGYTHDGKPVSLRESFTVEE